jgi:hypothetical protein
MSWQLHVLKVIAKDALPAEGDDREYYTGNVIIVGHYILRNAVVPLLSGVVQ